MINALVHHLPLLRKDHVGRGQDLLLVFLGICLDLTDLGSMGSPLMFSIVHLKEIELVGYQEVYSLFSYPGFKLYYPG